MKERPCSPENEFLILPNGTQVQLDKYNSLHVNHEKLRETPLNYLRDRLQEIEKHVSRRKNKPVTVELFIEFDPVDINLLSDWEIARRQDGGHYTESRTGGLLVYLEQDTLQAFLSADFPYTDKEEEAMERVGGYIRHSLGEITNVRFCAGLADAPAWSFQVIPDLGRTVAHCVEVARCFESLLRYRNMDPSTPQGVLALTIAGQASCLIGRIENDWLEVKQSYGISDKSQKHEFACDVASFANAGGGIIVVGITTNKDSHGRDVISAITPCRNGSFNVQTYQQAVSERVIPTIEGISFDVVGVEGGDLLAVQVPEQQEAKMPFIVKGGTIGDNTSRIRTSSFSIPVRRNAEKEFTTPEWVHSLLASGRAFMNYKSG
ncbi:helix-turn-helix domain-containing protein [Streptomyces anulatus]